MDHLIHDEEIPKHERELTLSTGSILGIFLGLVVLCGGFFGFGYNMGRKSAPTPLSLSDVNNANTEAALPGAYSTTKPNPGSPVSSSEPSPAPVPAPRPHRTPPPVDTDATTTEKTEAPKPTPAPTHTALAPAPAPIVRPAPVAPSSLSPVAGPPSAGSFMVQVAAVSHKEDADLLVGALRGRGYAVSARPATGDTFIHVQIGPFHSKQEADAMRQRLLTDGYNAIVKQ
jgi:DedD protein